MKSAMKQPEVTRPKFVLWMDSDAVPVDFEVYALLLLRGRGRGPGTVSKATSELLSKPPSSSEGMPDCASVGVAHESEVAIFVQ
jgi:hypothetical protein